MDQNLLDAYYEAAHRGGCQAKAAYASKASRFMNINILPALKSIDNSIFIIEGEAENNGAAVVDSYRSINPSCGIRYDSPYQTSSTCGRPRKIPGTDRNFL